MLARPKVPSLAAEWLRLASSIAEALLIKVNMLRTTTELPLQPQTGAKPLATVELNLQLVVVKVPLVKLKPVLLQSVTVKMPSKLVLLMAVLLQLLVGTITVKMARIDVVLSELLVELLAGTITSSTAGADNKEVFKNINQIPQGGVVSLNLYRLNEVATTTFG
eukprot:jgi/Phyca11/21035/fgenesh1_pg.PHYCAscaffold_80_\